MQLIHSINSACCFESVLGTHFNKGYIENQTDTWNSLHGKINGGLSDINRCLTDIFEI